MREIVEPTLRGMAREGTPFRGVLFVGLMIEPRRAARPRVQRALRRSRGDRARPDATAATGSSSSTRGARRPLRGSRSARAARRGAVASSWPPRATRRSPATGDRIDGLDAPLPAGRLRLPRRHHARRRTARSSPAAGASSPSAPRVTLEDAARVAYDAVGAHPLGRRAPPSRHRAPRARARASCTDARARERPPDDHGRHRPAHPAALRPLAPATGGLGSVVAPPYDVIAAEQRAELAARDPHNVVRLILPRARATRSTRTPRSSSARWREEGVLVRDDEPAFYRYDQTFVPPGRRRARRDHAPRVSRARAARAVLGARRPAARAHALGPEGGPPEALPRDAHQPEPGLHALPRPARRARRAARARPRRSPSSRRPTASHHALAKVTRPRRGRAPSSKASRARRCSSPTATTATRPRSATRTRSPPRTPRAAPARRAPLLHDVPRERRRSRTSSSSRRTATCTRSPSFSFDDLRRQRGARLFDVDAAAAGRRRRRHHGRACAKPAKTRADRRRGGAADGRAALLTLRARRRPRRPPDARPAPAGPPQDRRRGAPRGHPRARPRDHPGGAGRQDEPLVPAGRRGGARRASRRARGRCSF